MRSLSKRDLRDIAALLRRSSVAVEDLDRACTLLGRIEAALRGSEKARAFMAAKRKTRADKKAAKHAETASIREAVFRRAYGRCEVMDPDLGSRCVAIASELHHIFGRVRVPQSTRNCLAVCAADHYRLTNNAPSADACWRAMATTLEALGCVAEAQRARDRRAFTRARALAASAPNTNPGSAA